jgi:hypothetical protein
MTAEADMYQIELFLTCINIETGSNQKVSVLLVPKSNQIKTNSI